MTALRTVTIDYRRPPDRLEVFEQLVLEETDDHVVTFLESAAVRRTLVVGDTPILEPGSPVVWFTFPDLTYDIGRFHLADGTFTGYYANVLTPVIMSPAGWETTDLFLDVWLGADGVSCILDEDEFESAVARGWVDEDTAKMARRTADELLSAARKGTWPPSVARAWTLTRARRRVAEACA